MTQFWGGENIYAIFPLEQAKIEGWGKSTFDGFISAIATTSDSLSIIMKLISADLEIVTVDISHNTNITSLAFKTTDKIRAYDMNFHPYLSVIDT